MAKNYNGMAVGVFELEIWLPALWLLTLQPKQQM